MAYKPWSNYDFVQACKSTGSRPQGSFMTTIARAEGKRIPKERASKKKRGK